MDVASHTWGKYTAYLILEDFEGLGKADLERFDLEGKLELGIPQQAGGGSGRRAIRVFCRRLGRAEAIAEGPHQRMDWGRADERPGGRVPHKQEVDRVP